MDSGDIKQTLGSVLGTVGEYLKLFCTWIGAMLRSFCFWAADAVSEWFSNLKLPMPPTFLKLFSNSTINLALFYTVLSYIIIMNISAFIMYGTDKKKSKSRKSKRISEASLLKICAWGGAAGGLIGMQVFRHKTLHKKFRILVPVMFAVQLIFHSFVLGFLGFWAFF